MESGKIKDDARFTCESPAAARTACRECYRHTKYKIIDVIEEPVIAVEVIAKGSFLDTKTYAESGFIVETTTVRANSETLMAWHDTKLINCRNVYQDGIEGDDEWTTYQAGKEYKAKHWREAILKLLNIDPALDGTTIHHALAEVFTVVRIWEAYNNSADTD